MTNITIILTDEKLQILQRLANELGLAPEALIRAKVETWLTEPKAEFTQVAHYVLNKNAELYNRLA